MDAATSIDHVGFSNARVLRVCTYADLYICLRERNYCIFKTSCYSLNTCWVQFAFSISLLFFPVLLGWSVGLSLLISSHNRLWRKGTFFRTVVGIHLFSWLPYAMHDKRFLPTTGGNKNSLIFPASSFLARFRPAL